MRRCVARLLVMLSSLPSASIVSAGSEPGAERGVDAKRGAEESIELARGEYLHVAVRAVDVDLTLELQSPAGASVWKSDDLPAAIGLEELWTVAAEAGPHRLIVTSRWSETGKFRIETLEKRPASPQDRLRAAAELAYRELPRRRRQPGADLEALLVEQRAARSQFERLGMPERSAEGASEEAILLRRLGRPEEAIARL